MCASVLIFCLLLPLSMAKPAVSEDHDVDGRRCEVVELAPGETTEFRCRVNFLIKIVKSYFTGVNRSLFLND